MQKYDNLKDAMQALRDAKNEVVQCRKSGVVIVEKSDDEPKPAWPEAHVELQKRAT